MLKNLMKNVLKNKRHAELVSASFQLPTLVGFQNEQDDAFEDILTLVSSHFGHYLILPILKLMITML